MPETDCTWASGTEDVPTWRVGPSVPNCTPETAPLCAAPSVSVQLMVRPTRLLAPKAIWLVTIWAVWSATACIFSRAVNCADCARNWLESVGFIGSWYFIWATISWRNMSLSFDVLVVVVAPVESVLALVPKMPV